jgi:hypothetical protein
LFYEIGKINHFNAKILWELWISDATIQVQCKVGWGLWGVLLVFGCYQCPRMSTPFFLPLHTGVNSL